MKIRLSEVVIGISIGLSVGVLSIAGYETYKVWKLKRRREEIIRKAELRDEKLEKIIKESREIYTPEDAWGIIEKIKETDPEGEIFSEHDIQRINNLAKSLEDQYKEIDAMIAYSNGPEIDIEKSVDDMISMYGIEGAIKSMKLNVKKIGEVDLSSYKWRGVTIKDIDNTKRVSMKLLEELERRRDNAKEDKNVNNQV